jgi:hypothetical protein
MRVGNEHEEQGQIKRKEQGCESMSQTENVSSEIEYGSDLRSREFVGFSIGDIAPLKGVSRPGG